MKEVFAILATIVVVLILGSGLEFLVTGKNFLMYEFWAPKFENARRDVYVQTQSYQQGSMQRLATLCDQVSKADDKTMLNDQIKQEFATFNTADVPDYLQGCLATARAH